MGKNISNKLTPLIELERQVGEQIYTALQGTVVEEVLRKTNISASQLQRISQNRISRRKSRIRRKNSPL